MDFSITPLLAGFFVLEWSIRIVMLFIVPRRRKPSSANAWLLLIMLFPTVGAILFVMLGSPKLPKARREKQRETDKLTQEELSNLSSGTKSLFATIKNDDFQTLARLANVLGGLPAMSGNDVTFLTKYDEVFSALAADFDLAKDYIHIEFFIAALDETTKPVFEALERAVTRGVKVRFLYDKVVSTRYPGSKKLRKELERIGVEYKELLPLSLMPGRQFTRPDLRNHRKIVVIDGKVAFSGSQNLIDKSYHRKDDLFYEEVMMRLQGPIVWQYNNIFRADWYAETGDSLLDVVEHIDIPKTAGKVIAQVLPSGPSHDHDNNLKFYTSMVHAAKKRVGIVVPYFIPDESFLDALTAAAQRGVEVTMINSEAIDKILAGHSQRSYYEELLEAGVNIYLYNAPVFLHAKQVLIDDSVAIIGSSNLDIRSFELDLEVTTILYDKSLVAELETVEMDYLTRSKKITQTEWLTRPLRLKMLDSIARLTAAFQ